MHNRYREQNKDHFANLFQFIRLNTAIPNFLANLTPELPEVVATLTAINNGDESAAIFSHEHSHLYVLYLIKEGNIPFWVGVTVYTYLMVLMQFTDKLDPKEEDKKYKRITPITIHKLSINGTITQAGEKYIREIKERLSPFDIQVDDEKFKQYILSLPPAEQWLINISSKEKQRNKSYMYEYDAVRDWLQTITCNYPLAGGTCENGYSSRYENYKEHNIPSSSIVNYFMHSLRIQPIFGVISWDTLEKMHRQNLHPLPLYSPLVKNNTVIVHNREAGFVPAREHDLAHAWLTNLLTKRERAVIYNQLLPAIKQWGIEVKLYQDVNFEKILNDLIIKLIDLDLTPISNYEYVRCFKIFLSILPNSYEFLFFVFKTFHNDLHTSDEKRNWLSLLNMFCTQFAIDGMLKFPMGMEKVYSYIALGEIIQLISGSNNNIDDWDFRKDEYTGKYSKQYENSPTQKINWQYILTLIQSANTKEMLWETLYKEYANAKYDVNFNKKLNIMSKHNEGSIDHSMRAKALCIEALKKFRSQHTLPLQTVIQPSSFATNRQGFVANMVKKIDKQVEENASANLQGLSRR